MAPQATNSTGIWLIVVCVFLIAMCTGKDNDTASSPSSIASTSSVNMPVVATETMYVAAETLNQRSAPDGPVVGKVSGGEALVIYERKKNWVRVSPDGLSPRWVASRYLCSGYGCYSPPRSRPHDGEADCPCSGNRVCIGPRGGRYCITSGGNKRYGL